MKKKIALITGVTGQDGSYLARFLLKKNYIVHGIKRRSSTINTERVDDIYKDPHVKNNRFILHYGDMTDSLLIINILKKIQPHEVYNLAAQSHVAVSFEQPEYTSNADALGALRILEAIRVLKLEKKTKFYQAGTSELYGKVSTRFQNEKTPFNPVSPYGVAKLYAHWITKVYREAYGIFACNGILFNHESPVRGETFVTRKVIRSLVRIKNNLEKCLYLGNIYSKRDWGHAKEFVTAQWLMMQKKIPKDYVIATGKQYSIKDLINLTCRLLNISLIWRGNGLNEVGISNGKIIIRIDKKYFRPLEVDTLLGNASKARKELNWKPKIKFSEIVKEIIQSEEKIIFVKNN
jgi:GDPmannose 4,6-dehydratase